MGLTEEELEFLRRYELESTHKAPLKKPRRKIKLTKLFYAWIGFLTVIPFAISAVFLLTMARVGEIVENEGLRTLTDDHSEDKLKELAQERGFQDIEFYVGVYSHRIEIVAGIFTVAILLIGASFLLRTVSSILQKEPEMKTDGQ